MHVNIGGPLVKESPHTRTKVRFVEGRDWVPVHSSSRERGPTVLDDERNWVLLVQNPKRKLNHTELGKRLGIGWCTLLERKLSGSRRENRSVNWA